MAPVEIPPGASLSASGRGVAGILADDEVGLRLEGVVDVDVVDEAADEVEAATPMVVSSRGVPSKLRQIMVSERLLPPKNTKEDLPVHHDLPWNVSMLCFLSQSTLALSPLMQ